MMKILEITDYQIVWLHITSHIKLEQVAQVKNLTKSLSRDNGAVNVITTNGNTIKWQKELEEMSSHTSWQDSLESYYMTLLRT